MNISLYMLINAIFNKERVGLKTKSHCGWWENKDSQKSLIFSYSVKDLKFPHVYFSSIKYFLENYRLSGLCKTKPTKRNNVIEPNILSFSSFNF